MNYRLIIAAVLGIIILSLLDIKLAWAVAIAVIIYYDKVIFGKVSSYIPFLNPDKELSNMSILFAAHFFGIVYGLTIMIVNLIILFLHQDIRNAWHITDFIVKCCVILVIIFLLGNRNIFPDVPYIMIIAMIASFVIRQLVLQFGFSDRVIISYIQDIVAVLIYFALFNVMMIL